MIIKIKVNLFFKAHAFHLTQPCYFIRIFEKFARIFSFIAVILEIVDLMQFIRQLLALRLVVLLNAHFVLFLSC